MSLGITFRGASGLGDQLQFSSFPENYFRNTGDKIIDVDRSWIFDYNPYVIRDVVPARSVNLWSEPWPRPSLPASQATPKPVYASQAERTSSIFGHVAYLRHPRLYRFDELPRKPNRVVVHTTGKAIPPVTRFGEDRARVLSDEILKHVRTRYQGDEIIQIGALTDVDAGVIDCRGLADRWEVIKIIAQAGIFIGVDSGPYWIAACYPGIFRKKVLMQYPPDYLRDSFIPMQVDIPHTHWHDASCLYFNRSVDDAGITYGFTKL